VLTEAIAALDPSIQELLQLYYQDQLTQQQIAKQQNVKQYTISRKLTKARESLLLTLTQWSQTTLHISPTSNVVKFISITLEEWLQAHFQAESL
jgi:DNA-binding transcriptional regulator LsrR (DeoR family)